MEKIILMPTGGGGKLWHLNTLLNPVSKDLIKEYITEEELTKLDKLNKDEKVSVWCLLHGRDNDKVWETLKEEEDMVIFVPPTENLIVTRVIYKLKNAKLASKLWNLDEKEGKDWELIFFVKILSTINLTKREILTRLGYGETDGLRRNRDVTEKFIKTYGSLNEFNRTYSDSKIEPGLLSQEISEKVIDRELPKKDRLKLLEEKIRETQNAKTGYVNLNGQRIKRNQLVVAYVKEKAGYKCQACGFTFTKRDGTKYVEAAHIEPLAESHMDTIENVVALCPNCHKKLDLGDDSTRKEVLRALNLDI